MPPYVVIITVPEDACILSCVWSHHFVPNGTSYEHTACKLLYHLFVMRSTSVSKGLSNYEEEVYVGYLQNRFDQLRLKPLMCLQNVASSLAVLVLLFVLVQFLAALLRTRLIRRCRSIVFHLSSAFITCHTVRSV